VRQVISEIVSIRDLLGDELGVREKEDNALLDSMLYAQQRLQEAVLWSFGDEAAATAAKTTAAAHKAEAAAAAAELAAEEAAAEEEEEEELDEEGLI
jgi:ribosomal protein L12E/L44/L45/RPP1/RPP2